MSCTIGITLGDVTGIGPEVTIKALASVPDDGTCYVLIGDSGWLERLNEKLRTPIFFGRYSSNRTARFTYINPSDSPLPENLAVRDPLVARTALNCLEAAGRLCLEGKLDGMVTAPVSKEAIIRLGKPFVGQTEFLSELAGTTETAMMLLGADDRGRWLRVALATTHLRLRDVAGQLAQGKIELAIELAASACRDLGLPRARVGVCGLNPHAGEGGEMGDEEITTIVPAVERARSAGIDVHGPSAADTLFYHAFQGAYDAVVAMYHDQGLVPLKMIGFEKGVNWTLGLPFIRTSPDHGTAHDIAGKGIANASSMSAAIELARQLAAKNKVPHSSVQADAHFAKKVPIG